MTDKNIFVYKHFFVTFLKIWLEAQSVWTLFEIKDNDTIWYEHHY